MPKNISLFGRSGCGKGTQAKLLMEHFGNMFYISTGDLFRDLAKQDTLVSAKIAQIMDEGGLPLDDIAIALLLHNIAYNVKQEQGILFDGAIRRIEEAKVLNKFLDWLDQKDNIAYILIDISRQEAFDRLTKRRICKECGRLIPWVGEFKKIKVCDKCGGKLEARFDDNPEAINARLDYYEETVVKAVEYLEEEGKLIHINGEQPIEDVFKDILKALK